MDAATVSDTLREGVMVALKLGGPLLILSMAVGILVAIFQAVTQIHEQSLSFILKLIVVVVVFFGGRQLDAEHAAGIHPQPFYHDAGLKGVRHGLGTAHLVPVYHHAHVGLCAV